MRHIMKTLFVFFLFMSTLLIPDMAYAKPGPTGFADLAERLLPSVVNISTKQTIEQDEMVHNFDFQFPQGSPFEEFFKEFQGRRSTPPNSMVPEREKPRKQKVTSLGSGFVIDKRGYIVTNLHVIQDAEEISVILHDDTNLIAKIVGRDKRTDLAVLKVETKKELVPLKFGNSDKTRVGDWILAIGNPFGLGGTVTTGIISARARDINSGPYDDYLQTDAPINRGNSGGPMFNMMGEVIGVNTAIFSPTGGSVGIGFAIPATIVENVVRQLVDNGSIKRGWLGVRIQAVTKDIADSLGLKKPHGALVSSVTDKGPAAKSGVKSGDVIIEFNDKKITEMHKLPRIVAETKIDTTANLKIIRNGQIKKLNVKLGELEQDEDEDDEDQVPPPKKLKKSSVDISELGISVTPITEALRKKYEISKDVKGLLIVSVTRNGLAAEYGVIAGDMIAQAAQSEVSRPGELATIAKMHKKKHKPLLLLIDRRGDLRFIALPFEK